MEIKQTEREKQIQAARSIVVIKDGRVDWRKTFESRNTAVELLNPFREEVCN
jgi:uncharacterized membrane protein YcaP (DUF421 family)